MVGVSEQGWSQKDGKTLASAARVVSDYLDDWDPIPVYDEPDEGPPPGEYDGLVWPIMRLLADGAPAPAIADYLHTVLSRRYGIPCPADADALADRLHAWWGLQGT